MAKLNHVFGNYLSLIIPLVKRTRTVIDGTETDTETEYMPAPSESVSVRLLRHKGRAFSFIPTVEGSHVTIEDEGKLPPGTYDVEVKISGGEHPMCFFDVETIEVHRPTEAAGIVPGETLIATTHTLQGAVFFDAIRIQGKSAYEIAIEKGFDGTEEDWIASLHGNDGVTPHIDPTTKHWMIGTTDTGIVAEAVDGNDGVTPHIDPTTKHWMIGTTDTGIVAEAVDGKDAYEVWKENVTNWNDLSRAGFLAWLRAQADNYEGPEYAASVSGVNQEGKVYYVPGTSGGTGDTYYVMIYYGGEAHILSTRSGLPSNFTSVYDISAANSNTHYATLSEALAAISDASVKKGGMSVKYIEQESGEYVQYILKTRLFTTDENAWFKTEDVSNIVDEDYQTTKVVNLNYTPLVKSEKSTGGITRTYDAQRDCIKVEGNCVGVNLQLTSNVALDAASYQFRIELLPFSEGEEIQLTPASGSAVRIWKNGVEQYGAMSKAIANGSFNYTLEGGTYRIHVNLASGTGNCRFAIRVGLYKDKAITSYGSGLDKVARSQTGYYLCSSAKAAAAKVVSSDNGYALKVGGSFKVKMRYGNEADNPTLNIDSTGDVPLFYNGEAASASNTWKDNAILNVFYDGENYQATNFQATIDGLELENGERTVTKEVNYIPLQQQTFSASGVTIEVNEDGDILLNGNCTSSSETRAIASSFSLVKGYYGKDNNSAGGNDIGIFDIIEGEDLANNALTWRIYDASVKVDSGDLTYRRFNKYISSAHQSCTLKLYLRSGVNYNHKIRFTFPRIENVTETYKTPVDVIARADIEELNAKINGVSYKQDMGMKVLSSERIGMTQGIFNIGNNIFACGSNQISKITGYNSLTVPEGTTPVSSVTLFPAQQGSSVNFHQNDGDYNVISDAYLTNTLRTDTDPNKLYILHGAKAKIEGVFTGNQASIDSNDWLSIDLSSELPLEGDYTLVTSCWGESCDIVYVIAMPNNGGEYYNLSDKILLKIRLDYDSSNKQYSGTYTLISSRNYDYKSEHQGSRYWNGKLVISTDNYIAKGNDGQYYSNSSNNQLHCSISILDLETLKITEFLSYSYEGDKSCRFEGEGLTIIDNFIYQSVIDHTNDNKGYLRKYSLIGLL